MRVRKSRYHDWWWSDFTVQDQETIVFKLNRKLKRVARRSACTYKASRKQIIVLRIQFMEKQVQRISSFNGLNLADNRSLVITAEADS